MAVKEGWKMRAQRAKKEFVATGKVVLKAPMLIRWAEAAIRFCLAAVLSGAEIFDGYAPFGVAMVGASGSGVGGPVRLVGCLLWAI